MTTDKHTITPQMQADLDAVEAALAGSASEAELTDLGRLALELRDERPEIDPFFTRDLDARAAAGFPRRRPGRAAWLRRVPSAAWAGGAASLLVASVVAVSLLGSSGDYSELSESAGGGSGGGMVESAPEPAEDEVADTAAGSGAAQPKRSASGAAPQAALAPPVQSPGGPDARRRRIQETSASLTLVAPPRRIADVADGIVRVTDALGGFVVSSTVSSTDGDGGGGIFEIRVPSAKLQPALAELSKLAHVQSREQSSQDITAESVSARDRLQDARAERVALLRRLARAATQAEIDSVKGRLRIVSSRIAAAKADLGRVNNRASFSNVSVSLASDPAAGEPGEEDGQWSPGDAARDAVRVLEVIAGVALIALAVALPLAVLGALLYLGARLATRRRRERALDAI